MKFHRIEKTRLHLKLFSFDSVTGQLRTAFIDNLIGCNREKIVEHLRENRLIGLDERVIMNPTIADSYSAPFKLYIDITDSCPLNCKHCLTKSLNRGNELPYHTIADIATECAGTGIFFVKLGGGEPIRHKNFEDVLRLFSNAGQHISLSTNGLSITTMVASILKEYHVKTTVSIEGTKEIDDEIRGAGHFEVALNALELLQQHGVNVCLRVTLTKYILDTNCVQELIDLAKSHKTKLKVSYCRPAGSSIDNKCLIDYSDKEAYIKIIRLLNDPAYKEIVLLDEGMMLEQPSFLHGTMYDGRICGCVNRSMHINSSGFLSPCVFLGENYLRPIAYKTGDIMRYWRGELDESVKKIRSISMPELCQDCDRLCKYECIATRLYFNNDTKAPDPNCLWHYT